MDARRQSLAASRPGAVGRNIGSNQATRFVPPAYYVTEPSSDDSENSSDSSDDEDDEDDVDGGLVDLLTSDLEKEMRAADDDKVETHTIAPPPVTPSRARRSVHQSTAHTNIFPHGFNEGSPSHRRRPLQISPSGNRVILHRSPVRPMNNAGARERAITHRKPSAATTEASSATAPPAPFCTHGVKSCDGRCQKDIPVDETGELHGVACGKGSEKLHTAPNYTYPKFWRMVRIRKPRSLREKATQIYSHVHDPTGCEFVLQEVYSLGPRMGALVTDEQKEVLANKKANDAEKEQKATEARTKHMKEAAERQAKEAAERQAKEVAQRQTREMKSMTMGSKDAPLEIVESDEEVTTAPVLSAPRRNVAIARQGLGRYMLPPAAGRAAAFPRSDAAPEAGIRQVSVPSRWPPRVKPAPSASSSYEPYAVSQAPPKPPVACAPQPWAQQIPSCSQPAQQAAPLPQSQSLVAPARPSSVHRAVPTRKEKRPGTQRPVALYQEQQQQQQQQAGRQQQQRTRQQHVVPESSGMHNGNQYLHGDIYANNKNNINLHIHGNVQMGSVSAPQLPMQQDLSQHRAYYRDTGLYRQPEFPQPVQYQPSLPTNGFPVHAPRLATQPVMRYGQAPAAQQQYYMPSESVAGPWTHPESGPFSTSTSQGTIIHVAGFSMQPTVAAPGPDVSSWSGADDVLPPSASSSHMVAHSSEDRLAKLKRKDEREHERDERTVRGPF